MLSQRGAGHRALQQLADVVSIAKAGDALRPVTVIAPSNIAGITARRFLASRGGIAAVDVTTLPRLAEAMATPHLLQRRPAQDTVIAAAWREVLQADPGAFAEVADHPATVTALVRAHRMLRDLDEDRLAVIAAQPTPSPDLVRLHRLVTAELQDAWYDVVDLLDTATDHLTDTHPPVIDYLPGRRGLAEQRFMAMLQQRTAVQRILLEDPPTTANRVLHATDADDEVRLVVRSVMDELGLGRRTAVLYTDRHPYARLIGEHLADAGVTVNGPGARPVIERAAVRTFLEILDLADQELPRAPLFQALGTVLVRDFSGDVIPTARWERYSRAAGVVRGNHWNDRLTTWIDKEAKACDRESAEGMATFARRLLSELTLPHANWQELAAWARELFGALIAPEPQLRRLPPAEQHASLTLIGALHRLDALDATSASPTVRALHDLLVIELSGALPRVGRFGDGVYVGPLTSGTGLHLDTVHIVGLSEDLWPGTPHDDVLLPDPVRELLDGALPTLRERTEDQRDALLAALGTAEDVVASFPRGDLRQTRTRLPSRWLLPTLREFSSVADLPATRWESATYDERVRGASSFAGELLTSEGLATKQDWRTRAAAAAVLQDVVVESAAELLRDRASERFTRYDGNLSGVGGLPDYKTESKSVSPTALEKYAGCPHAFFVERLLGVRPIENPEDIVSIPASELGTFIHHCMDELTKRLDRAGDLPGPGAPWTPAHRDLLRQVAAEAAAEVEQRGVTGHQRLWQVEREKVLLTLEAMLDADSRWRAETGAAVHAAELEFGLQVDGPDAVAVEVPGGQVLLRGSADKIDVAAERIYVTDIKSGRKSGFSGIKQNEPAPYGAKLQLPAYAYAALAVLDTDLPVTAGYWFVHKDSGRIDIDFDDAVRSQYGSVLATLTTGIAQGLFPASPPKTDDFTYVQCAFCNPDGIGYAARRREWAAKSRQPELAELVALIVDNEIAGGAQ